MSRVVCALLILPGLLAASVGTSGAALEFRTDHERAYFTLDGPQSVAGLSPLRVPGPLEGDFRLHATGSGLAPQTGVLSVELGTGGPRIVGFGRESLRECAFRGAVFPGLVQHGRGERGRAAFLASGATAGLAAALWIHLDIVKGEDRAADLRSRGRLLSAADPDGAEALFLQASRKSRDVNHLRDRRILALVSTATVWGVGFTDATLFRRPFRVTRSRADGLVLRAENAGRAGTLARSLLFPGLGHDFAGRGRRGLAATMGAVGAGGYLLASMDSKNRATQQRVWLEKRIEESTNGHLLSGDLAEARFEESKKATERNRAAWLLAGWWALSALDSIWSPELGAPAGGHSNMSGAFSVDPVLAEVSWKVGF
ncbi:MAG: hypothetical protein CME07_05985 [Gemmatimonadetes bacterium]|nr:hypothetical protein [Gemmatimonadota bacterium]